MTSLDYHSEVAQHVLWSILGVLVTASVTGFILSRTVKSHGAKATVANLNARTKSWWVMVLVILGALTWGQKGAVIIFGLISFMAFREFITVTPTRRADHISLFVCFFLILPYQYWLVYSTWYGMFAIMIPVYAFILVPILTVAAGDTMEFLERNARTQWGLMVCVYSISHIPMLQTLDMPELNMGTAGLILFLVIVTQGSDVLQYVWGKLIGKHPIAPKLSPKKTIEGFVGGTLSASMLGAIMHRMTPFNIWQAFIISFALCCLGFFGGLIMSAIKRERGIKDWGTLIEGHGGMMDRIDSLCFSAPFYFHVIRYFFER